MAVRVTVVCVATFMWVTVNVVVVLPAGIVMLAGTTAALELELVSLTSTPPVGAIPLSETVPVTTVDELPWTVDGDIITDSSAGG
jgi:hypothetical protein